MLRADLHNHTVLSPCGDIEMTPAFLVRRAKESGVVVLGVTDHNSTLQCAEVRRIGEREGVYVLCGAEITTREEVHVLAFVDGDENLRALQNYIDEGLPRIQNNPDLFGYQLVVDEEERVIYQEDILLISAIDRTMEEVATFVGSLGGIFIPAHIDKPRNSLLGQLGFIPSDLRADAVEVSPHGDTIRLEQEHPLLKKYRIIRSSDAHYPEEVARATTLLDIDTLSFDGIKAALRK